MIICVCNQAKKDCDKSCPKGRLIEPDRVWRGPWVQYYDMAYIKALKAKTLREMRTMTT